MSSERGFEQVRSVCAASLAALTSTPKSFRLGASEARYAPDVPVDWQSLTLQVRVDFDTRTVRGTATYVGVVRAASLRRPRFDADGVAILRAFDGDGQALGCEWDGRELRLVLQRELRRGDRLRVAIDFETIEPREGFYFIEPDSDHPARVQHAWSQGQDEDSKFWFPCHDSPNHKLRLNLLADVPEQMVALSNGMLRDIYRSAEPGRRIFDWAMERPLPVYLLSLTIGPFVQVIEQAEPFEVSSWVLPGLEAEAARSFGRTAEMIALYERLVGVPYPFEKYAQVAVGEFVFGGMENASMTTQTDRTLHDERAALDFSSAPLVSHELAHQWFGNLVTCGSWQHAWLNEGFATYWELLWREHSDGADEFDYARLQYLRNYMVEDRERYRRTLVNRHWDEPLDLFDRHLYEKGAAILHMLRCQLGDTTFFECVRLYVSRHADGLVETSDLRRAIEGHAGFDLGRFFEQWVEVGKGHPELKVQGRWSGDDGRFTLVIEQKQATSDAPVFHLRARLLLVDMAGQAHEHRLMIAHAREVFSYALKGAPAMALFDPRGDLLATVELDLPEPMLRTALGAEVPARARIAAAESLSARPGRRNLEMLKRALLEDSCWAVQAEVAAALGRTNTHGARDALLRALDLPHPKARLAVVTALGGFAEAPVAQALAARLIAGDPSYFVEGELARSLGRTRQPLALRALQAAIERPSWNETIRVGVFDGLAALQDPAAIALVAPWLGRQHDILARCGAVRCLTGFYAAPELAIATLEPWLTDDAFRFQLTLAAHLERLADRRALTLLGRLEATTRDGRVRRRTREAMRGLSEVLGSGRTADNLRDEMHALGRRQRDLVDRLDRHMQLSGESSEL